MHVYGFYSEAVLNDIKLSTYYLVFGTVMKDKIVLYKISYVTISMYTNLYIVFLSTSTPVHFALNLWEQRTICLILGNRSLITKVEIPIVDALGTTAVCISPATSSSLAGDYLRTIATVNAWGYTSITLT
jgi:hypothetical protein